MSKKPQDKELMRSRKAARKAAARAERAAARARRVAWQDEVKAERRARERERLGMFNPSQPIKPALVGQAFTSAVHALCDAMATAQRHRAAVAYWTEFVGQHDHVEILSTEPFRVQAYHDQSGAPVPAPSRAG